MESILGLAIWILCVWGCYTLAKNKGYDTGWAIFWGIITIYIALIIYAILPKREPKPEIDYRMSIDLQKRGMDEENALLLSEIRNNELLTRKARSEKQLKKVQEDND
jgi:hypothetical protein